MKNIEQCRFRDIDDFCSLAKIVRIRDGDEGAELVDRRDVTSP